MRPYRAIMCFDFQLFPDQIQELSTWPFNKVQLTHHAAGLTAFCIEDSSQSIKAAILDILSFSESFGRMRSLNIYFVDQNLILEEPNV